MQICRNTKVLWSLVWTASRTTAIEVIPIDSRASRMCWRIGSTITTPLLYVGRSMPTWWGRQKHQAVQRLLFKVEDCDRQRETFADLHREPSHPAGAQGSACFLCSQLHSKNCHRSTNRAFEGMSLNAKPKKALKLFARDSRCTTHYERCLRLSKILDWYGDDFIA